MSEIKPTLLPEGTILTTEGKDKILTGKLQRNVACLLATRTAQAMTLAELSALMLRIHGTPAQNVHRTVKALEAKGVLNTVKGVKGEVTLYHCIDRNDDGALVVDYDVEAYFGMSEVFMPGGPLVGNHDFVAAIVDAWADRQAEVFKTAKLARPDNRRWYFVTFNKPALYKLAARQFHLRVNMEGAMDALQGNPFGPLVEQAARGAWQPFFDTLKKNKVIGYHEIKSGGRVMVWDNRRWVVYSTRVMREREAILNSWTRTAA